MSGVKFITVPASELEGEPLITVRGAVHLVNALITQGECTDLNRAFNVLKDMNLQLGRNKAVVWCAKCANKFGVSRCSKCPKTDAPRYCSRACQAADWPAHKGKCGGTRQPLSGPVPT